VRRVLHLAALAIPTVLLIGSPASAGVTGGCNAKATIGNQTYTPANDTAANPVVLPNEGNLDIHYVGTSRKVIKDHSGFIAVVVGPDSVKVAEWSHPNRGGAKRAEGDYPLDAAYGRLLPFDLVGLYEIEGEHVGKGGRCDGSAMVLIEGNPLTTVPGATAAGLTLVTAIGMGVAAAGKKGIA
jgi:hypothetical protein